MPLQTLAQYMRPQEDHYGKSLRSIGNYKLAEKRMDQDQAQFDDRHLLEYKKYLLAGAQLTMDQQDAIFKVRDRYVDKFGAGMDEASYPGWYAALENDGPRERSYRNQSQGRQGHYGRVAKDLRRSGRCAWCQEDV